MARKNKAQKLQDLKDEVVSLQLRGQKALLETQLNVFDNLVDPRDQWADTPDFWVPLGYQENLPANIDNRKRGEVLPVYLTELGLKRIRDESRRLLAFNEYAINAIENRISYLVGKGFEYQAHLKANKEEGKDNPLVQQTQDVIDRFLDDNEWGEFEQEAVRRCDRDGECFVRFFAIGGGRTATRVIEPEHIRSPVSNDTTVPSNFGVETDNEDTETVKGFWVIENPNANMHPEFRSSEDILHLRLNTDRNAKRGLPTLLPVRKNLDRAEKLLKNMSILAQIQATIAMIRHHRNSSAAAVASFQSNSSDFNFTNPMSGNTLYAKQYQPGSILDADADTEYEFPAATVQAGSYVEILQAELRAVASRLCMPEYMLTADASNANFASTMVAESPWVKHAERLQAYFERRMGAGCWPGHQSRAGAVWRAIRIAVDDGELPSEALEQIEIEVKGPSLIVRDKDKETQRYATLNEKGVLSKTTWAQMESLDYEQEQHNMEAEGPSPQEQMQQQQMAMQADATSRAGGQEEADPFAEFAESMDLDALLDAPPPAREVA